MYVRISKLKMVKTLKPVELRKWLILYKQLGLGPINDYEINIYLTNEGKTIL